MKHGKEPWEVDKRVGVVAIRSTSSTDIIVSKHGEYSSLHKEWSLDDIHVINAKRIVACVNACAGFTNEELKKGVQLKEKSNEQVR